MIKVGGTEIVDIAVGSTPIKKAYIGSTLVWEKGSDILVDGNGVSYYKKNYITCDGTANTYINTGTYLYGNSNYEIKLKTDNTPDYWFGDGKYGFFRTSGIFRVYYNGTASNIQSGLVNGNTYTLKIEDGKVYYNGSLKKTYTVNTSRSSATATLGKVNSKTTGCSASFYYLKWWDVNDNMLFDMVPAQRITDGVWGMFNKVDNTFHPSNGSAQFTGG